MSSSSESDSSAVQRAHYARVDCFIAAISIAGSELVSASSLSVCRPDTHRNENASYPKVADSRGNTHLE